MRGLLIRLRPRCRLPFNVKTNFPSGPKKNSRITLREMKNGVQRSWCYFLKSKKWRYVRDFVYTRAGQKESLNRGTRYTFHTAPSMFLVPRPRDCREAPLEHNIFNGVLDFEGECQILMI